MPENTCWKPVEPGHNCDWKAMWRQDATIQAIFDVYKEWSLQLQKCMKGTSPYDVWNGGLSSEQKVQRPCW